jgi:hypothetical protein
MKSESLEATSDTKGYYPKAVCYQPPPSRWKASACKYDVHMAGKHN